MEIWDLAFDSKRNISVVNLGTTNYASVWRLQREIVELRYAGKISDVLLLNEHRHVYTLGKSSDEHHLLAQKEELIAKGVEVFHIDRGGDVTYHGPGQLVGYPILDLNNYYFDIHRYLRELEEVIIRALAEYGISAHRDKDFTGVWVGGEKIAAIGVKVARWMTMHGFALNVNTDLSYFDRIIPCGIFHKGVTSTEQLLGRRLPVDEVARKIAHHFLEVFDAQPVKHGADELSKSLTKYQGECIEELQ